MHGSSAARVTGIGVITSLGCGVGAFGDALKSGVSGISFRQGRVPEIGGFLLDFDFERHLKESGVAEAWMAKARRVARRSPRSVHCSALVGIEAWRNAGLMEAPPAKPERVAVVVGGQNISAGYQFDMFRRFLEQPEYVPASYGLHFLDTDHLGVVSELLDAHGEGATVGAASASGNAALLHGLRLIRMGSADVCVVIGAMADLSPMESHAFRQMGAAGGTRFTGQPAKACRPFDADRDGFIYGQGAACLILERESAAVGRGAPDFGCILGGAVCLDANRSSEFSSETAARAMRAAMEDAGVRLDEIDYVNAHATSSILGDERELEAIKASLGTRTGEVWINSTKELTGHCLWAAGAIEAAAVLIQCGEKFLHPNPNLENPIDTDCRFVGRQLREAVCRTALNNSFGFGGINTSLVLRAPGQT